MPITYFYSLLLHITFVTQEVSIVGCYTSPEPQVIHVLSASTYFSSNVQVGLHIISFKCENVALQAQVFDSWTKTVEISSQVILQKFLFYTILLFS